MVNLAYGTVILSAEQEGDHIFVVHRRDGGW